MKVNARRALIGKVSLVGLAVCAAQVASAENVTIATFNGPATTDLTPTGGQFDVVAIGTYETPQWGKRGWLVPMTNLPADYDLDDVVKTARDGLSYDGQLYALPFYVETLDDLLSEGLVSDSRGQFAGS